MEPSLTTTIVSTGGAVIVGVFGMFFANNQIGKRLDDLRQDFRDLRSEFNGFRAEFNGFKETVNGKFAQLDLEIAKLMDK